MGGGDLIYQSPIVVGRPVFSSNLFRSENKSHFPGIRAEPFQVAGLAKDLANKRGELLIVRFPWVYSVVDMCIEPA
jgi:hypothetical protein